MEQLEFEFPVKKPEAPKDGVEIRTDEVQREKP